MRVNLERLDSYLTQIKENAPSTKLVDISFENPDYEQLQQILTALSANTVCSTLNLSVNNFSADECELIAHYLAKDPAIETIFLSGNNITSDTAIILFQALCFNSKLHFLYLNDNLIDDDAISHIQQLQSLNSTLQKIDLTYNKLTIQGLICLGNFTESQCEIHTNSYKINDETVNNIVHRRLHAFFKAKNQITKQLRDFDFDQPHSLIDLVKHTILNSFQQQMPFEEFFFICTEFEDCRDKCITMLLEFSPSDDRDEFLRCLGNVLFTLPSSNDNQEILDKAYAHICFAAITTQKYVDKVLLIENYRSLVSEIGLTQERDFRQWKNSANLKPYPVTQFADKLISTLFHTLTHPNQVTRLHTRSINTSLEILYAYKNKTLMHEELKTAHSRSSRPTLI